MSDEYDEKEVDCRLFFMLATEKLGKSKKFFGFGLKNFVKWVAGAGSSPAQIALK